jgi:hypothetical protein
MTETDRDRIVKLETRQDYQDDRIHDVVDRLDSLDDKVGKILETMQKSRGFFNGVIFAFSILGAAVGTFAGEIWHRLAGNS